MITYKKYKQQALKNPGFRREYEKLRPEFDKMAKKIEVKVKSRKRTV